MEGNVQDTHVRLRDLTSNPGPLGLLGFGVTTVLLNIHNTGYYGMSAAILAMGVFYGGLAQIFAGWMEWKKGNTFGTVAFSSYGLFWLTLVYIVVGPDHGLGAKTSAGFMGWYLFFWGFFTLCMFIGTLKINRALQAVFGTLVILFWLLAIGEWAEASVVTKIAGWEGIICGLSAVYAGVAQILNEVYGKVLLSLGPVKK